MGDGRVHGFGHRDIDLVVILSVQRDNARGAGNLGMPFEFILHLRVIGNPPGSCLTQVNHEADVVANGRVIAFDGDQCVLAVVQGAGSQVILKLCTEMVYGRSTTNGHVIIDPIGNGRLQGYFLGRAIGTMVAPLKRALIIIDQTTRGIETQTNRKTIVKRRRHIGEGHAPQRYRVPLVRSRGTALRITDVVARRDDPGAAGNLTTLQLGQACRISKDGAGVQRG
ncbi:hypothetical protein D3C76_676840 [compost metagenome]